MKPYLKLFLLLLISLHLGSCSPIPALTENAAYRKAPLAAFTPVGELDQPLLLKAGITLNRDYYSGLFLIKKMESDSSVRVVFLSELGLNMLDLEYRDSEVRVVTVQDFMDRPRILKLIKSDIRTLLLDLSAIDPGVIKETDDGITKSLAFRMGKDRYICYWREEAGIFRIERKGGIFRSADYAVSGGDSLDIKISHRRVRLQMDLHQVKRGLSDADR